MNVGKMEEYVHITSKGIFDNIERVIGKESGTIDELIDAPDARRKIELTYNVAMEQNIITYVNAPEEFLDSMKLLPRQFKQPTKILRMKNKKDEISMAADGGHAYNLWSLSEGLMKKREEPLKVLGHMEELSDYLESKLVNDKKILRKEVKRYFNSGKIQYRRE